MEMKDRWQDVMLNGGWTPEVEELINCVESNGELFEDMLFSEGTISHSYIAVQSSSDNGQTWFDDEIPIPEELEYFSYGFFDFHIAKIDGGSLDVSIARNDQWRLTQTICMTSLRFCMR